MNQFLDVKTLLAWQEVDQKEWKSIVDEILTIFLSQAPLQFSDLLRAKEKNSFTDIRMASHKLKSSFGNVGLMSGHRLLKKIEEQSQLNSPNTAMELIKEFSDIYPSMISEVEDFKKKLNKGH